MTPRLYIFLAPSWDTPPRNDSHPSGNGDTMINVPLPWPSLLFQFAYNVSHSRRTFLLIHGFGPFRSESWEKPRRMLGWPCLTFTIGGTSILTWPNVFLCCILLTISLRVNNVGSWVNSIDDDILVSSRSEQRDATTRRPRLNYHFSHLQGYYCVTHLWMLRGSPEIVTQAAS